MPSRFPSQEERFQDVLQKPPKGIGDTRARARERGKTRRRVCRHARPASLVSRQSYSSYYPSRVLRRVVQAGIRPRVHERATAIARGSVGLSVFTPTTSSPTVFMASRHGANGGTLPPGGLRLARIVVVVFFFLLLVPGEQETSIYLCH